MPKQYLSNDGQRCHSLQTWAFTQKFKESKRGKREKEGERKRKFSEKSLENFLLTTWQAISFPLPVVLTMLTCSIKNWSFISIKIEFLYYFPFDTHDFSVSSHHNCCERWSSISPSLWHAEFQSTHILVADNAPPCGHVWGSGWEHFLGRVLRITSPIIFSWHLLHFYIVFFFALSFVSLFSFFKNFNIYWFLSSSY